MKAKKRPSRKKVPTKNETAVLAKSARRCALCFHLKGDLEEKIGQVAHLDGNRANGTEDNLAFMCLPHHSLFDSKTSQHKNYTIPEVKVARSKLYGLVSEGRHLITLPAPPKNEADKEVFRDLLKTLPSDGAIQFVREHDFSLRFRSEDKNDIRRFLADCGGPEHEFIDSELEVLRKDLMTKCSSFLSCLGGNTWSVEFREGFKSVPEEWRWEQPERFKTVVKKIHREAESVCRAYDQLVRAARKKLA
jgi:hypothetical protein